jgi:hypothetical protein
MKEHWITIVAGLVGSTALFAGCGSDEPEERVQMSELVDEAVEMLDDLEVLAGEHAAAVAGATDVAAVADAEDAYETETSLHAEHIHTITHDELGTCTDASGAAVDIGHTEHYADTLHEAFEEHAAEMAALTDLGELQAAELDHQEEITALFGMLHEAFEELDTTGCDCPMP